jgi:hypothetical protein
MKKKIVFGPPKPNETIVIMRVGAFSLQKERYELFLP